MKKIFLAALLVLGSTITFSKGLEIPHKYRGAWDKTPICQANAVFEKDWFTSDTDWGAAELRKVEPNGLGGIIIYGVEEFRDEGMVHRDPVYLDLTLSPDESVLKITGRYHGSRVDDELVRCKPDTDDTWHDSGYVVAE